MVTLCIGEKPTKARSPLIKLGIVPEQKHLKIVRIQTAIAFRKTIEYSLFALGKTQLKRDHIQKNYRIVTLALGKNQLKRDRS